jgi:hypothetical protein
MKQYSQDQIDTIARVCHEANRAYCISLGDTSQKPWDDAPDWQKESARLGVNLHLSGDHGPEASHKSWSEQKIRDGWVYGPTKDEVNKTHHCLVDFSEQDKEIYKYLRDRDHINKKNDIKYIKNIFEKLKFD